jgi:Na+/H+ antiporter
MTLPRPDTTKRLLSSGGARPFSTLMAGLELVLLLLAVAAGMRLVAQRLTIPFATLLVIGGLLLAFIPGLPRVTLPPDVLFLIFVPPLLYWGAAAFPLRDFRREGGAIVRLAVVLVLVSTAAVAVVAHALHPSFTWAAAITLGAIVSPPDPVAVFSVARSFHIPRWIASVLEGEGLVNDATALVVYRLAVASAVTSTFSPARAALDFALAGAGGVVIGLVFGVIVARVQRVARQVSPVSITISLLTPFASYLAADTLGASGVLSVVATGLYGARTIRRLIGPETRMLFFSTWTVVTFMLESLVFIIVGIELPYVLLVLQRLPLATLLREAALVSLCVVVVRIAWVIPSTYLFGRIGQWLRGVREPMPALGSVFFIAFTGLRGGDSLVLALALPLQTATGARFPAREQIIFITFGVIFITLVVQGPLLAPLARRLGLGTDDLEATEEARARRETVEAGLRSLDDPAINRSPHPEIVRHLRQQSVFDGDRAAEYRRIRSAMLAAEQRTALELRDRGVIGDDVLRRLQRELDLESLLLETISESPR